MLEFLNSEKFVSCLCAELMKFRFSKHKLMSVKKDETNNPSSQNNDKSDIQGFQSFWCSDKLYFTTMCAQVRISIEASTLITSDACKNDWRAKLLYNNL
jgi:hypothetical protein